jgi:hypothetical protein
MPTEPTRPVIAGVDDSPIAAAVVNLAVEEAAARGVPVVLLHAAGVGGRGPLDGALDRARTARPGLAVTGELVDCDPVDALADRAVGGALLVLGHGGHGARRQRPRRAFVALRLLERVGAPLIVYRPQHGDVPQASRRPVVVGVDGLRGSETAVEFGFAEAALYGTPLLAMHLWPPADRRDAGRDRAEAEGAFLDLLETWSDKYPQVPVEMAVRHNLDVVIVLAAASRSARLVVVSLSQLPSSALAALIDRAGCPVGVGPAHPLDRDTRPSNEEDDHGCHDHQQGPDCGNTAV